MGLVGLVPCHVGGFSRCPEQSFRERGKPFGSCERLLDSLFSLRGPRETPPTVQEPVWFPPIPVRRFQSALLFFFSLSNSSRGFIQSICENQGTYHGTAVLPSPVFPIPGTRQVELQSAKTIGEKRSIQTSPSSVLSRVLNCLSAFLPYTLPPLFRPLLFPPRFGNIIVASCIPSSIPYFSTFFTLDLSFLYNSFETPRSLARSLSIFLQTPFFARALHSIVSAYPFTAHLILPGLFIVNSFIPFFVHCF